MIKKAITLIIMSFFIIACSRAIPKPADAQMLRETHRVIGENYFSTKTLVLFVRNSSGAFASYRNDIINIQFLLPMRYKMYRKADIKTLLSTGTYQYTLNFYRVNEGELNLEGKNGLMIHLIFKNTLNGTFYAEPNVMTRTGYLSGNFKLLP